MIRACPGVRPTDHEPVKDFNPSGELMTSHSKAKQYKAREELDLGTTG
jgi:hypothetical protein